MSIRHEGRWHYEFLADRPVGHQWRVADRDDDVVCDFPDEEKARTIVQAHNANLPPDPTEWRF